MSQKQDLSRRDLIKLGGLTTGMVLFPTLRRLVSARPLAPAASAPHIILIIVDALRSDHIAANGYARLTTPNLDMWVTSQGANFCTATSTASWTYPANAAIFTGRLPSSVGAGWDNTTLPVNIPTLAEYLHAAGYYTAGFSASGFVSNRRGFGRGFDVFNDDASQHPTSQQEVAAELNSYALDWLNAWIPDSQPLFLFLYYLKLRYSELLPLQKTP